MEFQQTPEFIRDMKRGEEDAVETLLTAAFPGPQEAALVHNLRKSGAIAGESVMPMGDRIIGYFALSRMIAPKGWLALAPVAIHPDVQRCGYGKRMMGMLTEWARLTGTPVVVLGAPAFYQNAGFSAAQAAQLITPYSLEHTLLAGVNDDPPAQTLRYPAAFNGL